MNIIAIETASTICGVALFLGSEMKEKDEINQPKIHGERLPVIVESILDNHLININELDGIAISAGPGSYTGLRIGMSFVRGLAASGNLPIIPVPTLMAINFTIQDKGKYRVMLHSHKDYIYAQNFNSGTPETNIVFEKFQQQENQKIYGFNLEKLSIDFNLSPPSVESVGKLALQQYLKWKKEDPSEIKPNYITDINI